MKRRLIAAIVSVVFLGMGTVGCIGNFALSGKVRQFNLEQSKDRWGREILFVILYVIPVYPFAGFADIIVFNSIEFWSGKNPVDGSPSVTPIAQRREIETEDGTRLVMSLRSDDSIDVAVQSADGEQHFVNLTRSDGHVAARDASGALLVAAPSPTAPAR
ncbi:MAG: DUF3332 family protein [Deltaproteobacteria bacterium]|nr:MAG: DUF3332 family protein [Deltaproteobacteria bacterium]